MFVVHTEGFLLFTVCVYLYNVVHLLCFNTAVADDDLLLLPTFSCILPKITSLNNQLSDVTSLLYFKGLLTVNHDTKS